jgi:hypothetical protein
MFYDDPYVADDMLFSDYWNPEQERVNLEFYPPLDATPPFQPPIGTPQFTPRPPRPRPPRPRPPFFPPTTPGFPWQDGSQGIRRCLNRNTMIWLNNGRSFWFYPTNVTPQAVIGFRWTRTGWVRNSIERRDIRRFECQ